MTDLQIGLIVLALVAIGAVWLSNALVERRRRRVLAQRHKPIGGEGDDAGSSSLEAVTRMRPDPSERNEPGFGNAGDGMSEIDLQTIAVAPPDPPPGRSRDDGPALVDDAIHAVVTLEPNAGQVSGERVLSLLHAFRHAGRQPVALVGIHEDRQEPLRAGRRYDAVLVAVQLANRSGPLNEIEWSEFVVALQHAAEQIPATCELPDMRETTARARALDAVCVPLDAQIGINLAGGQTGWSAQTVADLARESGLILRPDGRFHALDDRGVTLFVLQNGDGGAFRADTLEQQSTSRLTLLLDVPRAPQDQKPYERLVALANQLAASLDAAIVDDQSRVLTPRSLASIGLQIEPVYAKLTEAGMPAGSPRALALFG